MNTTNSDKMLIASKRKKAYSFILCLMSLLVLLSNCRRDTGIQTIILNKTTHNSYDRNNKQDLAENETFIYHSRPTKVSIIAADLEITGLRFRISLIDVNQDGYFDTPDMDMLVLSPYEQDSVAIDFDRINIGKLKKRNYIKVNRTWFCLLEIDSLGQQLRLVPLEKTPRDEIVAEYCTRWKPVAVTNTKGEATYLKRSGLSRKELILVSRMPPLDDSFLQLLEDNKEKWAASYDLTVLYMGGYDKAKTNALANTISFKFPAFFTVFSSCKVINCHANPPFAFLLDKNGSILKENMKREEIIRFLITQPG